MHSLSINKLLTLLPFCCQTSKGTTAAFRKCMTYARSCFNFYMMKAQIVKTQASAAAGTLHCDDPCVMLPKILHGVEFGRELSDLPAKQFFYLVTLYMNNSRNVRMRMKGQSKRSHCNQRLKARLTHRDLGKTAFP